MEYFLVSSAMGTLVLLVVHLLDYLPDFHPALPSNAYDPQPGTKVPPSLLQPVDPVAKIKRAA